MVSYVFLKMSRSIINYDFFVDNHSFYPYKIKSVYCLCYNKKKKKKKNNNIIIIISERVF